MSEALVKRLTIIGVGLIGGSFAQAVRAAGEVGQITGCGRQLKNLDRAVELGVIDDYSTDIGTAVKDADLIFIAAPVGSYKKILTQIKAVIKPGAIITDAGSTKTSVIEAAEAVFTKVPDFFVPGHPIAGTENSGVEASFSSLFQAHRVILTPLESTDPQAVKIVTQLWQSTGAKVVTMDHEHHDLVLAATSHLPHLLAFSLVNTLATVDEKKEIFEYAAGGFRDFTRIASSDPTMWQDICIANKEALLEHLQHFSNDLSNLTNALKNSDASYLYNIFSKAKQTRDDLS